MLFVDKLFTPVSFISGRHITNWKKIGKSFLFGTIFPVLCYIILIASRIWFFNNVHVILIALRMMVPVPKSMTRIVLFTTTAVLEIDRWGH